MRKLLQGRLLNVDPISLVAGSLALVSLFSAWWGYTSTYSGESYFYGLFPPFYGSGVPGASLYQLLNQYSLVLFSLGLMSGCTAVLGSFTKSGKLIVASFAAGLAAVVAFPVALVYSLSSLCNGLSWCMLTPNGSGYGFAWGLQLGYYLVLAGAILDCLALALHQEFVLKDQSVDALRRETVALPGPS